VGRPAGPEGTLVFDAHAAVPPLLILLVVAVERHGVLRVEGPALPGNIEIFKKLRQVMEVPLATGERDRTVWELPPDLRHQGIDIP
jgi:galactonate dehydratase